MAYPRVPPSQIRPPIPPIPPMPAPPIMPIRNGRNRFSQPVNPMMAPVAFNRQGKSEWNVYKLISNDQFFFIFFRSTLESIIIFRSI